MHLLPGFFLPKLVGTMQIQKYVLPFFPGCFICHARLAKKGSSYFDALHLRNFAKSEARKKKLEGNQYLANV